MIRFLYLGVLLTVIEISLIVVVICWSSGGIRFSCSYSAGKCSTKAIWQQLPLVSNSGGSTTTSPRRPRQHQPRRTNIRPSRTSIFGLTAQRKASVSSETMDTSRNTIDDTYPRGEAATSITKSPCDNWRVYDSSTIQTHEEKTTFPFDHTIYNESTCWSNMHYNDALGFYNRLRECEDPYLAQQIKEALDCLDGAYRLYGPAHLIGSYNGGKDAVVVLHLMRAAHAHYYNVNLNNGGNNINNNNNNNCLPRLRPRVVFFDHPDEFPQIITLLQETVGQYDLDMVQFTNTSFRQGLQRLVTNPTRSQLAFVLGTRTSDPNSQSQGHFSPSSPYMPPFMRINPIFHWSYGQIWHFLRMFQLPYCYLYDQGYTSLGTVKDTLPCPALRRNSDDGSGTHYYMPAYTLNDWDQERAGRINASSHATSCTTTSKVGPRQSEQKPPSLLVCGYESNNNGSSLQHQQQQQKDASSTGTNTEKSQSKTQASNTNSTTTNELGGKGSCKTIVGLLIIGDEILKGLCSDSNILNAANALRSNGLLLSKVVIVPDEQEDIVNEIKRLQKEVDVIITSGGVGATHDDVTIRSVGIALNSPLVYHKELGDFIRKRNHPIHGYDQEQLTPGQIKMATLPKVSKLRFLSGPNEFWYYENSNLTSFSTHSSGFHFEKTLFSIEGPTLQCRYIYVLPGVPRFFKSKIDALASHLIKSATIERSETYKVVLSVDENTIVEVLNEIVCRHPYVSIGSYPFFEHSEYKTIVTLEGKEGPPLFPGETRVTLRKRSESLFIYHQQQNVTSSCGEQRINSSDSLNIGLGPSGSATLSSPIYGLFTKEEMDLNVRMALDDLISVLPDGSVIQVDNEDFLS